jgi:hypothetical protein
MNITPSSYNYAVQTIVLLWLADKTLAAVACYLDNLIILNTRMLLRWLKVCDIFLR